MLYAIHYISRALLEKKKKNVDQASASKDNTQHALTTNLACIFFQHFLLVTRNER